MTDKLNKILPKQGVDIIAEMLEKYSNIQDKNNIDDFLTSVLTDSKAYKDESEISQTVKDISQTIDSISNGYQEIQEYKSKGLSSAIWLRDNLDKAVSHLAQTEKDSVISSVKTAMSNSNNQMLKALTGESSVTEIIPALVTNSFSDLNKTAIANNFKEEIKANTLFGAISFEGIVPTFDGEHQEVKAAKEYFENKLDCKSDDSFKKVVAAGVEIAKKKDMLPVYVAKMSTDQITSIVDNGVTTAKVAYKVASGDFEVTDATDYLIDRAASRVGTVIKKTCEKVGANVGAVAGATIGALFGPGGAAVGAVVGRVVGFVAGKVVGAVIVEGVKKVANFAKEVVRSCWEGAKSLASSAWESFKSSKLNPFNWF